MPHTDPASPENNTSLAHCLLQEAGGSLQALTARTDALTPAPTHPLLGSPPAAPAAPPAAAATLELADCSTGAAAGQAQGGGTVQQLDAYGGAEQMGAVWAPRIVRAAHCASADPPYQLLPLPRCARLWERGWVRASVRGLLRGGGVNVRTACLGTYLSPAPPPLGCMQLFRLFCVCMTFAHVNQTWNNLNNCIYPRAGGENMKMWRNCACAVCCACGAVM